MHPRYFRIHYVQDKNEQHGYIGNEHVVDPKNTKGCQTSGEWNISDIHTEDNESRQIDPSRYDERDNGSRTKKPFETSTNSCIKTLKVEEYEKYSQSEIYFAEVGEKDDAELTLVIHRTSRTIEELCIPELEREDYRADEQMISSSSSETYDKYESDKKQEPFEPGDRQEGNPSEKETNEEREYEPFEQEDRQEGDLSEKEAVEEREYESLEPQDRQEVNPSEKETVEEREYEPLESQDRQKVNPTEKETVEEREYEKSLLSELEFEDDEEKKVIVSEYVENETRKAQKISKTGTKSSKKSKKQKRKNRSKRKLTTTSIEGNIERKDFIVVENLTAQQKFLKASIASCMEFLTPDDLLDDDCPETFIFSDDEKNTSGGSSTDTGSETMDLDDENINPPIMNPEIKSTSTGTENITKRSKRAKKNRKNKTKKKGAEADKLLHNNENQSDKENHPPQTNISEGATKSYVVYLKNDEHFADDDLKQYCDERDRVHEISCSSTETSSETLEFMNNDEDAFSDTILERSFRRIDKKRPKDEENFEQQVYKTSTKQCIKTIPREEYDDGARGGDWIVDSAKHKEEERIEFLWVETPCGQFKCLVDNCGFISESQDEQVQHLDEHKDIFY